MINKIYETVHNKYSNFFKFFFFIRYIFLIFLLAMSLFLTIPKFFDYKKKEEIIKEYLIKNYFLEINEIENIKYNIFPFPNLSLSNVNFTINNSLTKFNSDKIEIFLNFENIYKYKDFNIKKMKVTNTKGDVEVDKSFFLINYFNNLKNKINIENLNLILTKNSEVLTKIKNINLVNYGYNKNNINGLIFEKDFFISFKDNKKSLDFIIKEMGVKAQVDLKKNDVENSILGFSQVSLLNNLLKFNFEIKNDVLKVYDSNFRNKAISLSLDGLINFAPFFSIDTTISINEIEQNYIEQINLEKIINKKELLKKLNGNFIINYENKRYFKNLVNGYQSSIKSTFGRVNFSKTILFAGGEANCEGDSVFVEEFPRLNFYCNFKIVDKKKLFKKLSINIKDEDIPFTLGAEGSINILNKKINFNKIQFNENFLANKEDLNYFKEKFENILFNGSFFEIFKKEKISNYILEII